MRTRLPLLLSMTALLLLAVLATRGQSGIPHGPGLVARPHPPPPVVQTMTRNPSLSGPLGIAATATVGVVVLLVIAGVLAFILLGVIFLASLRFHRRRRGERLSRDAVAAGDEPDLSSAQTLLRGARAAAVRMRLPGGGPPSDAVQAAWVALETAAGECGTPRRADRTSTEFTSEVLAAHQVSADAVATLLRLYLRARFGPVGTVTSADAADAVAALDRIAADLTARPVGAR
jgi:hypothetical protein